jgi:hypothetical protein
VKIIVKFPKRRLGLCSMSDGGLCLSGEMTQMDELGDRSWIRVWDRGFSFLRLIQTSPGPHLSTLMGMVTGTLPTRARRPGHEADVEVKSA